jgi:hypothetical protein
MREITFQAEAEPETGRCPAAWDDPQGDELAAA